MAQQNKNQPKAKTGLARCLELASGHKGLVFLSGFLAALAAICSFVPYLSIYYIIREILFVYPDMSLLNVSTISTSCIASNAQEETAVFIPGKIRSREAATPPPMITA